MDVLTVSALIAVCGGFLLLARYALGQRRHGLLLAELLGDTFESVPHGLLLFGNDEKLRRMNTAAAGQLAAMQVAPASFDQFLDFMFGHRLQTAGCSPPAAAEVRGQQFREIVAAGGRTCLVQASAMRSGEMIVLLTDITEFKQREDELLQLGRRNYALAEAIEASPNGFLIVDPKRPGLPVIFASRAYIVMAGLEARPVAGEPLAAVLAAQKTLTGSTEILTAVEERKAIRHEWTEDHAGAEVFYQLVFFPVLDAQGNLDLYIGQQNDVTESKRQQLQFIQSQKLEALGQLAGGVAHDFNNVLSIVEGYARMAKRRIGAQDAETAGYLDRITQASRRGAALTRQLLLFGRHKIVGDKPIDIARLIAEQERLLLPLLGSGVTLKIQIDGTPLVVECQPDNLAQIVMNLVVNARDAMPEGGAVLLEMSACAAEKLPPAIPHEEREKPFVRFCVRDTGIGIDPAILPRIFDPFFTTKEQGKGTGLGLSMVYGLVKDMKGHIDVQSVPGQGTAMAIYLPLSDRRPVRDIAASDDVPGGLRFDGYTALVAEDEPDLRALLCDLLEEMGMEVIAAANGAEALMKQDEYEGDIDLLLTDVVMPELDGVKLAELLQAVREETRVIFMSGFPAGGSLSRIEIPQGARLLAKPVAPDKLAAVMKAVLDEGDGASAGGDLPIWRTTHA